MSIAIAPRAGFCVQLGIEAILAAMGFIRHDDHVPTIRQHREAFLAAFGREFLHRREDDAARCARQQALQVFPAFGLFGILSEQILAETEGGGELVVQIITIGQHNDGGVFKLR